jgi:hypothetical protein
MMDSSNEPIDPSPEQRWDHLMASPWAWFDAAWVLKDCATIIGEKFVADLLAKTPPEGRTTEGMPPMAFGPVFQLLAGYSLENVLKGIIIAQNPNIGKDETRWRRLTSGQGHKLLWLCEEAKISLDESSRQFLERLTEAMLWIGRYPVTKRREDMQRGKLSRSDDVHHFVRLYKRFTEVLQAATRPDS